jgi:hypothetical protein
MRPTTIPWMQMARTKTLSEPHLHSNGVWTSLSELHCTCMSLSPHEPHGTCISFSLHEPLARACVSDHTTPKHDALRRNPHTELHAVVCNCLTQSHDEHEHTSATAAVKHWRGGWV